MNSASPSSVRLLLGGDVMLGRQVGETIVRHGTDHPLGPVAAMMRMADLTVVNLECAITSSQRIWAGAPKAFYFGAPPEAAQSLRTAGVDMVSLANNHVLDFGVDGLMDTLRHLNRAGIRHAGAGKNCLDASVPALAECRGVRFGIAAFCDHQDDFAATADRPGIAYIDFDDEDAAMASLRQALEPLRHASIDWPILSLHWGSNMVVRPSPQRRRLAHAAIDMGWKILFGHSAHVFHGVEIYRDCPIFYAVGDLVDDYYVDPQFNNDLQLLFELEVTPERLRRIRLYPVRIARCQVRPATGTQFDDIVRQMTSLCAEMGTKVHHTDGEAWIEVLPS